MVGVNTSMGTVRSIMREINSPNRIMLVGTIRADTIINTIDKTYRKILHHPMKRS